MNSPRVYQLLSIVLALLLGATLLLGFQAPAEKSGVVDLKRLIETSDLGKEAKVRVDKMRESRQELLDFIENNRVMTLEQATRIRDLAVKETRTKEEQAELDSLRATVTASTKRWNELATKANMTAEERTLVQEYSDRAQRAVDLGGRWVNQFTTDVNVEASRQQSLLTIRAKSAIQEVARTQGFTLIYDSDIVPYGANDITDAALVSMNAKRG